MKIIKILLSALIPILTCNAAAAQSCSGTEGTKQTRVNIHVVNSTGSSIAISRNHGPMMWVSANKSLSYDGEAIPSYYCKVGTNVTIYAPSPLPTNQSPYFELYIKPAETIVFVGSFYTNPFCIGYAGDFHSEGSWCTSPGASIQRVQGLAYTAAWKNDNGTLTITVTKN